MSSMYITPLKSPSYKSIWMVFAVVSIGLLSIDLYPTKVRHGPSPPFQRASLNSIFAISSISLSVAGVVSNSPGYSCSYFLLVVHQQQGVDIIVDKGCFHQHCGHNGGAEHRQKGTGLKSSVRKGAINFLHCFYELGMDAPSKPIAFTF